MLAEFTIERNKRIGMFSGKEVRQRASEEIQSYP
jgi:hypothetical protein